MIELTYAKRYYQTIADEKNAWGMVIQLVRTDLKWTRKEGMQMSGTWEGKIPESGLYLFVNGTSVKFFDQKTGAMDNLDFPMYVTFQTDGTWDAIDFYYNFKHPGIGAANGGGGVEETHPVKDIASYTLNVYTKDILTPQYDVNLDLNYIAVPERWLNMDFTMRMENTQNGYVACYGGYFFTAKPVINPSAINGARARQINPQSVQSDGVKYAEALPTNTMAVGIKKKSDGKDYWNVLANTANGYKINSSVAVDGNRKGITTLFNDGTLSNKFNLEGNVLLDWDGSGIPVVQSVPQVASFQINQCMDMRWGLRIFYGSNPYQLWGYHATEVDFYNQKTTYEAYKLG